MRSFAIAFLILASMLAPACDGGDPPERRAAVPPDPSARPGEVSATREAFLAELSPLPSAAILVVYAVAGPGGLEGTLEVMLRPGGWRRENWSLKMPVAGDRVELLGTTIQTPDVIYTHGPQGQNATAVGLGALADAWLLLDPGTRDDVIAGVRKMHDRRARPRVGAAPPEIVLGLPCRAERVAAQDVCVWDAAGLPLRATGGGFTLDAIRVELEPELGESAFEIPADVTTDVDPDPLPIDAALGALAQGEPAPIAAWLHPGVRMATPRAGA